MATIDELWTEYRSTGSKPAKDKLLVEYASLVKYIAQRVAMNLPASVEFDDLVGAGIMGLVKSVEMFEPERGLKFETFATHKIRGAILDELRALDWVPRSVRQKNKTLQKAYTQLEHKLGRMPYDDEVAAHLNLTTSEFEEMLSDVAPTTILSLEEALPERGDENKSVSLIDTIEDPQGTNPLKELGYQEVKRILKETIAQLPEKEKLVVALYHYEELTLKEIGEVLNLTESRVSQIHSKAMLKLKAKLLQKINAEPPMAVDQTKRIRRITDSLISLPTLPTITAKMLDLVDNPRTSASSLAGLIMQDQVLTARILKLANSSFYAFPRQIATVKLALVVLGFESVKEMALSLSVLGTFKGENNKHFDTSQFWQHSVAVGACSRMLARETCHRLAGEAFVAGLLHDIGKVVLNQYLPEEFGEVQSRIWEKGASHEDAERIVLGATHAEIGAWLAERWNLPVSLVEAIRWHDHPEQCPRNPELALLVCLSDYLAEKCRIGRSGSQGMQELPKAAADLALSLFSLTPESLEAHRAGLYAEYDKASSFMVEAA